MLDFVNEAAHTSSTVSQDDTYVLFITDSIYANIINKKLSAGQTTKVNVQDAADRLTEGDIHIMQQPRCVTTGL